jgi:hypothetical protein
MSMISRSVRIVAAVVICGPTHRRRRLAEFSRIKAPLPFLPHLGVRHFAHATLQGGFIKSSSILYRINRQLNLLFTRADRCKPWPCRDSLVRRIERLNVAHHLILAKMKEAVPE